MIDRNPRPVDDPEYVAGRNRDSTEEMYGAGSSGGSAPLVGRDAEIRALGEALERSVAGHGHVVLLAGEPGIGKTRLSDEVARHARKLDAQVLSSRCYEWSGAPAYWPWKQAIDAYLGEQGVAGAIAGLGDTLAPLAPVIPQIASALRELPEAPDPDREYERFQVFEAGAALVRRIARRQPAVFVLDDLHWADAASLLLLEFLTPALRELPIFILGTYRDTDMVRGDALSRALSNLVREPNVERVFLRRLTRPDIAEFVAGATGHPLSQDMAGRLYDGSDGNPLFMTEIVRMLTAEFGPAWATDRAALTVRLPETIRDTVLRRMDRLPQECAGILSVASVIGREFRLSLLSAVLCRSTDVVLEALEPALRARIVEPVASPGAYRFSHVLVQEAIYGEIGTAERARLHKRIAGALEQASTGPKSIIAELAHHYYRALPVGDTGKAIHYAVEAGDQAMQQVAWESAVEQYDRALSLFAFNQVLDDPLRCDVLLSLGSAQWLSGHPEAARDSFQTAYGIAKELRSPERQARAVLGFAGSGVVGVALRDTMLIALIEETLDVLGPGDSLLRVRLLCQLLYFTVGDSDRVQQRRDYAEEALAMGRRLHDDSALLQALDAAWYAFLGPDMLHERMAIAEEQLQVAERAGDTHAMMLANGGKADDALLVGDLAAYTHHIEMYRRFAGELRLPFHILGASHMRAGLVAVQGSVDEARRQIERIPTDQIEALPNGAGRRMLTLLFVVIFREQERLGEILDRIDELHAGSFESAASCTADSNEPACIWNWEMTGPRMKPSRS